MATDSHNAGQTAVPPLSADRDVEKNLLTPPPGSQLDQKHQVSSTTSSVPAHHVNPQLDKLKLYQELVGISSSDDIDNGKSLLRPRRIMWWYKQPTNNTGYYKRILDEELRTTICYATVACVYNSSLMLQVLIAATITALAASSERRVTITILGGINTAIAGLVAYLKGQGLPHRLFQYRNQMRRVREYAEFVERKFEMDVDQSLDPAAAAETIKTMYNAARKDQEDNFPDNYVNSTEKAQMAAAIGATTQGGNAPKQGVNAL